MLNFKKISKALTLSFALTFTVSSFSQDSELYRQVEELRVAGETDAAHEVLQGANLEEKVDYLIAKDLAGVLNGDPTAIITADQCTARGGTIKNCSNISGVSCPTGAWCFGADGAFIDDVKN